VFESHSVWHCWVWPILCYTLNFQNKLQYITHELLKSQSQWPHDEGGRLVAGIAGSNPTQGMDVCLLCLCFVLSCVGRGLYDELITRPEESYRVSVCVITETPKRGPMFQLGTYRKMNEWVAKNMRTHKNLPSRCNSFCFNYKTTGLSLALNCNIISWMLGLAWQVHLKYAYLNMWQILKSVIYTQTS
jgi:hypothetical protein